jgi:cyclophilin family peptidyl-prolyl cis-trans isomerase
MKTLSILALAAALWGCAPKADTAETSGGTTTTSEPATTTASNETTTKEEKPPVTEEAKETNAQDPAERKPADGEEVAVMKTNLGRVVLMFFPDKAPLHVANFKKLASEKFYNGTKFHRVIPGFMIQGGDPNSKDGDRNNDGTGNSGQFIKAEFNDVKHERGILSMARSASPDSASCQFFIMVNRYPSLDGSYSAFGKVVEGMDVVDKIVNLERDQRDNPLPKNPAIIESITIEKWPLKS